MTCKLAVVLISASCFAQSVDTAPRVLASVTYANLGTPSNGAITYCSNCTAANPTASGGAGAIVRRENGAWNGGGGSGSGGGSDPNIFSTSSLLTELERRVKVAYYTATQGVNLTLSGTTPQAITLATVACDVRWEHILISITTQFTGGAAALVVKLQHNGVDLTSNVSLKQTGGDINYWVERPGIGCMGSGTATLQAIITGDGAENHNAYTAGAFTVEVAGYVAR